MGIPPLLHQLQSSLIMAASMSSLVPLHRLLVQGRIAEWGVCRAGDLTYTWRHFAQRCAALAAHLAARSERRWALCCEDPYAFACALFAVWHCGRIAVVPPNFQAGT